MSQLKKDLFEAIPDVVQIEDDQSEKRLALTVPERLNILSGIRSYL